MRQHADDRPPRHGGELRFDQGPDLRLCLRNGEVERQRRYLVRGTLMPEQLVADLRSVAVRDDQVAVAEQRPHRLARRAEVRALLRRRAALAGPRQRVAAQRDDREH